MTSRAATGTLSDSLLVLLDGRSIYQDFFGFVAWDFLPVDTSEINQIEVIRGPATAVWGANAMTGVVNVISKTPREMQGTSVTIRFGQFDRSRAGGPFDGGGLFSVHATHAEATSSRFAYMVSAGLLTQEPFLRPTGLVLEHLLVGHAVEVSTQVDIGFIVRNLPWLLLEVPDGLLHDR